MTDRKNEATVSVVTPSYNQGQYIEETIASVMEQTYPHVEQIVIDGESTDGTLEILCDCAGRYPERLRWISEPDEGQADAVNKGFRLAEGEIIGWLNSDDAYLFRDTLARVVQAFESMPWADIIYGDAVLISSDNRLLKTICAPPYRTAWLRRGCRITQPAVFFRRRVIEAEQLDASISIVLDYEFWLRLSGRFRFAHVPGIWAVDRNHPRRKILARRPELISQTAAIKRRYGQRPSLAYRLGRTADKMLYALPSWIRGLFALREIYRAPKDSFAIPLQLSAVPHTVARQLFARNRDLL